MTRAIIVEDEINVCNGLIALLEIHCPFIKIVHTAATVSESIARINETKPELVFLDIHLSDGSGFDVLKGIENKNIRVIFITAYSEYALKAIKFAAIDYILKPVIPDELIASVKRATTLIEQDHHIHELNLQQISLQNSHQSKLVIKTKNEVFYLAIEDIIYCQSDINYTLFKLTSSKPILVSKTLKYYEDILKEHRFCRIHQSYLVNRQYARSLKNDSLLLSNGESLVISRKRKSIVDQWMKSV